MISEQANGDWIFVIVSTLIFGFYHIHVYFTMKHKTLAHLFIVLALILGFLCSMFFLFGGLVSSIIIHWLITEIIYTKLAKEKQEKE